MLFDTSVIHSIIIGALTGIVYYGLSFVNAQKKDRFLLSGQAPQTSIPFSLMGMSMARILCASLLFYVILHSPYLNPILILITFISVFWSIILVKDLNLWNRSTTS